LFGSPHFVDLLFYAISIILIITLANATSKFPEDGAEAPKYVGAF
jgi:hypothetical protein